MTVLTEALDLALRSSFLLTILIGALFGNPEIEFSDIAGNSPSFHILFFCFWGSEDLERVEEGEEANEHRMTVVCFIAGLISEVGLSC